MAAVDPRYDPRFQRGFDATADRRGEARESAAPDRRAVGAEPARAAASSPAATFTGSAPAPVAPAPETPVRAAPVPAAPAAGEPPRRLDPRSDRVVDADDAEPARRNPYRIGLLALALGQFALSGVIIARYIQSAGGMYVGPGVSNAIDTLLLVAGQQLLTATFLGGVVALVGWILVGALGSEPRRGD